MAAATYERLLALPAVEAGPFDGARIKVVRAVQHCRLLSEHLAAVQRENPVEVTAKLLEGGGFELWVECPPLQPSLGFSTIIGDVIHNLRSALDLVAADLIRRNWKEPSKAAFPIVKDADSPNDRIKSGRFNLAGRAAERALRSLRPYGNGHPYLWGLHELNNRDKHRALIPVISGAVSPDISEEMVRNLVMGSGDDRPSLAAKVRLRGRLMWKFPPDVPFAGQEIEPTLIALACAVEDTIEGFARL